MSESRPSLTVRPRRIVIYAAVAAAAVLGSMIAVGVVLRGTSDGVSFRVADQVGLIGVGVVFAALILVTAARPRVIADESGLSIRNMVGARRIPWQLVNGVAFPEGAQWPHAELADDESYPMMAIQAMDRGRAIEAMRSLRTLVAGYAPNRPKLSPQALADRDDRLRRLQQDRPLGRLELDDMRRARERGKAPGAGAVNSIHQGL